MQVEVTDSPLSELQADLHVVMLAAGADLPEAFADAPGAADADSGFRELAMLRPAAPERVLVVGAGDANELDAEKLRVLAATVERQSRRYKATRIAWDLGSPALISVSPTLAAAAIVEGAVMATFRFDRYKPQKPDDDPAAVLETLTLATGDAGEPVERAANRALVAAEAANRARTLQSLPANELTPGKLAERAAELAEGHPKLTTEALGRGDIAKRGLGGLEAVGRGATEEPRLITLRYEGRGGGEVLGLVGKAVTFDSGGISIKPSAGMHEMKMDMSGGAAVLEAIGAIAELDMPIDIVAVIPSTENMPAGNAMRPGDVITQLNGKTVEVTNTDAEGRLILADALTWCVREMGADRVIDLATLTGAVLVGLGSTYAALITNDDDLAAQVSAAAESSGELAWRLPLHPEYKKLTEGTITDLVNSSAKRKAGTIYAASFLEEFVDSKPWAHLDIAGTAWDTGREYVGSGPTGYGVRLLVELAHALSA